MKTRSQKFFYNFDNNILEFLVKSEVYYPREDSLLFADFIIDYLSKSKERLRKMESILDVGCGCGFISIIIYKFLEKNLKGDIKNIRFVALDINSKAVENTKINAEIHKAKIIVKRSNLFQYVKEKFDLITFNAPYLPVEEDYSYSVFQKGVNIVDKFLVEAKEFINYKGSIFLLVSSLTPMNIPNFYKARLVKNKKIDWEELRIYEIKLR